MRETAGIRAPLALVLAPLLGVPLVGCAGGSSIPDGDRSVASPPTTAVPARTRPSAPPAPAPALCRAARPVLLGRIADPAMDELSGLTRGRRDPAVLFATEDSGAGPVLTAVRTDGRVLGHATLTGAANGDWEDIAAGPGPGPGDEPSLFVGDVGDNTAERASVQVYRVPEPRAGTAATDPAVRLDLVYPDGAHDAEALLADPLRRELTIITKGLGGGRLYTVPRAVAEGAGGPAATLHRGPVVHLPLITAGDVSGDGRIVALRTYAELAVWRRRGREPLERTLARPPTCVAHANLAAEGQGEALALDRTGAAAITAPEGARPLLRRYGG